MRNRSFYAVTAALIVSLTVLHSASALEVAINVPMNRFIGKSSPKTLPTPTATPTAAPGPTNSPTSTPKPTVILTHTPTPISSPTATPTPVLISQLTATSSANVATTSAKTKKGSFTFHDIRQTVMIALVILLAALFIVFLRTFTPLHDFVREQIAILKRKKRS